MYACMYIYMYACRWFDKSFSLIFTPSGHAALNFEHAWGDGVAVLRFFNEMYKETTENPIKVDPGKLAGVEPADSLLQFNLSDKVKKEISLIKNEYQKVTSSLDVNLLEYDKFGKAFVKSKKLSPDGIMQLSFQVCINLCALCVVNLSELSMCVCVHVSHCCMYGGSMHVHIYMYVHKCTCTKGE